MDLFIIGISYLVIYLLVKLFSYIGRDQEHYFQGLLDEASDRVKPWNKLISGNVMLYCYVAHLFQIKIIFLTHFSPMFHSYTP